MVVQTRFEHMISLKPFACMSLARLGSVMYIANCMESRNIFPSLFQYIYTDSSVRLSWEPEKETEIAYINRTKSCQQQMQATRCNNAKPVEKCCATRWHTWNVHSVRIESAHLTVHSAPDSFFSVLANISMHCVLHQTCVANSVAPIRSDVLRVRFWMKFSQLNLAWRNSEQRSANFF